MSEKYVTIWEKLEESFNKAGETIEDVVALAIEGGISNHKLFQEKEEILRELHKSRYGSGLEDLPYFMVWTGQNVYLKSFSGYDDGICSYDLQRIPKNPTLEGFCE